MFRASTSRSRAVLLALGFLLSIAGAPNLDAADLRKILLVHSYGRSTAPLDAFVTSFQAELRRAGPGNVAFYDFSLEAGRPGDGANDAALVQVLHSRFGSSNLDLVVLVGAQAMRFYLENREALFPTVPLLVAADHRFASVAKLKPADSIVGVKTSGVQVVNDILELLPETNTVAVIFGSTPGEQSRAAEFRNVFAPFEGRVKFVWLNNLPLSEVLTRVAALPPGAVVLYGLFQMDSSGVLYEQDYAINQLHRASSAPMFGFFESQIGQGMVGGRVISTAEQGVVAAKTAGLMLNGGLRVQAATYLGPTVPQFDWRELQRWDIDENRLPPGSIVRFRPPPLWEEHRFTMIAGFAVLLSQAALIAGLVIQRARRRRAERESQALTGRLFTAHEDERRRLARELHDDVTQRLARLAIDAARFETIDPHPSDGTRRSMHGELVRLSEDVHALSYRLHPSIVDDLGLAEALKAECEQVSRRAPVRVAVELIQIPDGVQNDVALCVFRVTQEALRNVARHAKANAAIVSLAAKDGGLLLVVRDNGIGFDVDAEQPRSLGRMGMNERVRLLGGNFRIESGPGQGTTVSAWVPLKDARAFPSPSRRGIAPLAGT